MGKWRGYLIELEQKGIDWTNPVELITFAKSKLENITLKVAQQIVDARIAEIDDKAELEKAQREWKELNK